MKHFTVINGKNVYSRWFKDEETGLTWCQNHCDQSQEVIMRETIPTQYDRLDAGQKEFIDDIIKTGRSDELSNKEGIASLAGIEEYDFMPVDKNLADSLRNVLPNFNAFHITDCRELPSFNSISNVCELLVGRLNEVLSK